MKTLIRNATIINDGKKIKGSVLLEGKFIKKIVFHPEDVSAEGLVTLKIAMMILWK